MVYTEPQTILQNQVFVQLGDMVRGKECRCKKGASRKLSEADRSMSTTGALANGVPNPSRSYLRLTENRIKSPGNEAASRLEGDHRQHCNDEGDRDSEQGRDRAVCCTGTRAFRRGRGSGGTSASTSD